MAFLRLVTLLALCGWLEAVPEQALREETQSLNFIQVDETGIARKVSSRDLASPELGHKRSRIWVWGPEVAPRSFSAEEFTPDSLDSSDRWLEARIQSSGSIPPESVLIAGPTAMWNEVPEPMMPRFRVSKEGRARIPVSLANWRLRVLAANQASWWVEPPAGSESVNLTLGPALDFPLPLTAVDGQPVSGANLEIFRANASGRSGRSLAKYTSTETGRLDLKSIPMGREVAVVITHPLFAPVSWLGASTDFPTNLSLPVGHRLRGKVIDQEHRFIPGATITVSAWAGDAVAEVVQRQTTTAQDGSWEIANVPGGELAIGITADGYSKLQRRVSVEEPTIDLGTLSLESMRLLTIKVVGSDGRPLQGTRVNLYQGYEGFTDDRGLATLRGVPGGPLRLHLSKEGYVPAHRDLVPPVPELLTMELLAGFTMTGLFLDAAGLPTLEADIVATQSIESEQNTGTQRFGGTVDSSGRFQVLVNPRKATELVLSSPKTRSLILPVVAGEPGEVRDIGEHRAPQDLVVQGQVVDAVTQLPIPGARIWLPRQGRSVLQAWLHDDILTSTCDSQGRFQLQGLIPGSALIRVDAPGYGRRHLDIHPETDQRLVDVGVVELSVGSQVEITTTDPAFEGAQARLDLRGASLALDQLLAKIYNGRAVIHHVPSGPATVLIQRGFSILCETAIEVPEGETAMTVACERQTMEVTGTVQVATKPTGPGSLTWMPPANRNAQGSALTMETPDGLRRMHLVTNERPPIHVPVLADGTFSSNQLVPGSWEVLWSPDSGGWFEPSRVKIPNAPAATLTLDWPGLEVQGRVLDEEGQPVVGARVWRRETGAMDISTADGTFVLSLAEGGTLDLRAQKGEKLSPPYRLEAHPGDRLEPVELILARPDEATVNVEMIDLDGNPAIDALLFVETMGSTGVRTHSSDASGQVRMSFKAPFPKELRYAARIQGVWVFQGWRRWEDLTDGAVLAAQPPGSLSITAQDKSGLLALRTPQGQDLTFLLTLSGLRPVLEPSQPLEIRGLPAGGYSAQIAGSAVTVQVREEERSDLAL